ncbi:hypothetical protein BDQ17DRAFT_1330032 [Cyathus striatus]|nr:hypothetical protein BDQ17DRAFT_1330032 [Cyathus striatus]
MPERRLVSNGWLRERTRRARSHIFVGRPGTSWGLEMSSYGLVLSAWLQKSSLRINAILKYITSILRCRADAPFIEGGGCDSWSFTAFVVEEPSNSYLKGLLPKLHITVEPLNARLNRLYPASAAWRQWPEDMLLPNPLCESTIHLGRCRSPMLLGTGDMKCWIRFWERYGIVADELSNLELVATVMRARKQSNRWTHPNTDPMVKRDTQVANWQLVLQLHRYLDAGAVFELNCPCEAITGIVCGGGYPGIISDDTFGELPNPSLYTQGCHMVKGHLER